ncbi:PHB depolymerase family esterase [Rhizobacter sp. J219]|uniref:extracellular catalytic domain type 2 short-chain-length polyhydroxyalkanoate depolymerase n=1 Tax=Rhizobacter sp. J219 TaxID=2898430 RepID=UPI0021514D79|nr:PHB depolymerase family esterase [Rhizobacter sp. J219]MCR5882929.1 PHB depolymerase family esterase [Rhizobacter sp. J219]
MNRPRFLAGLFALVACTAQAGETLRSFNADLSQTTVSGLSAGAFFATQIQVAHSQHIKGMGSIAGGPYFCAEGSINKAYNAKQGDAGYPSYTGQCMGGNFGGVDAAQMSVNEARQEAGAGRIDALAHLANAKIFIFGGTLDPTVVPNVVAQNKPFYTRLGVPEANIRVETTLRDGHAMPLKDRQSIANACGATNATYGYASVSPWMSNCDYDTAGVMLEHFYGTLNARVPLGQLRGRFVQFDQSEFTRAAGARYMNTEGFMYVPPACDAGERCRVHVAFHGCHQVWDKPAGDSGANMGDRFYRYAGYNEWAENNRIIVLYPQAQKTPGVDPRGCFDWWGFEEAGNQNGPCNNVAKTTYGQCSAASYHTKSGAQVNAVWRMLERVTAGGAGGGNSPPVITGLSATSEASCSTLTASVSDPDNDVASVQVRVDGGSPANASPAGNGSWTYRACPGTGTHTASVTATDGRHNTSAAQTVSFTISGTGGGGLTPGSGTWVAETQTFGLGNAYVYVPKNPNPAVRNGKRALMLSLHGCLQSAADVINTHFNWEAVAEQRGMVVVVPTVPASGRVVTYPSNCWNWFGTSHSRTADDAAKLLQLVDALKRRADLSIDPQQVYASGLSAGSGEAHVLGCLAPEVFAGIGLVAGPALGSAAFDVGGTPRRSAADVAATCRALAGSQSAQLDTQIASFLYGTSDVVVNPQHNVVNAEGMKLVFATGSARSTFTVSGGGSGSLWTDAQGRPRVSLISVSGMDHSWPAGPGGTQNTNYVNNRYLHYPEYLSQYLFDHNLRVGTSGDHPVLRCNPVAVSGTSATLDCAATDNGTIASYHIVRSGPAALTETVGSGATLRRQYANLPAGRYTFEVTATDNTGLVSNLVALQADVGSVPPPVQSITATVVEHYTAKRITLQQYLSMGSRLGYNTRVTLYRCTNGWSESAACT